MKLWPLHVKDVTIANLENISQMKTLSPVTKSFWQQARRWVDDISVYSKVVRVKSAREVLRSRLTKPDIAKMLQASLCRKLRPEEVPLGTVDLFPVGEPSKTPPRRRRIGHSISVNRSLGKDTLQKLKQASRSDQLRQALTGEYSISLDFAAYFDAFELKEEVQLLHCFRVGEDVMCLTRLPMGQRQSVEVAQGATNVLLDFDLKGATAQSCIDNVRFVGTRFQVIEAARAFIKRCNTANIKINDLRQRDEDLDEQLSTLAVSNGDWLGIHYDLKTKRVRIAQKSVDKLKRVKELLKPIMSAHQVASVLGVIFFCSSVLRGNVAKHFTTMRFLRLFAKDTSTDAGLWVASLTVPEGVLKDMQEWIDELTPNEEIPIFRGRIATTIVVDASVWGWGAVAYSEETGAVHEFSKPWSEDDRRAFAVDKSVYAEPLAAYRALCHFVNPNQAREQHAAVKVLSDNVTAVSCINAGYSPSFNVNRIANSIRTNFRGVEVVAEHIAGSTNEADGLSRGKGVSMIPGETFGGFRGWSGRSSRLSESRRSIG
jgi:hypothetical protein